MVMTLVSILQETVLILVIRNCDDVLTMILFTTDFGTAL